MKDPRESLEILEISFKDRKKSFGIVKQVISNSQESRNIQNRISKKSFKRTIRAEESKMDRKSLKIPEKTKRILRNVLKNF